MLQANAPPVEPQPSLKAAARLNVGDRLLRALYPPQSSAAQLRWFGFAMLALAAIFPWLGGPFYTRLAIESFLFGAIALSVDILLGYAGLLSLGQAAYFGLAAYISALMYLHVTQSFWLVLLAVVAAVAVFSLVLGAVAIRAKGVYFALITFGAAEILSKIAHNTRAIGGSDGLIGIPVPHIALLPGVTIDLQSNFVFYHAVLVVLVLIYVGTQRVLDSGFGAVLRAISRQLRPRALSRLQLVLVQASGIRPGCTGRGRWRPDLPVAARVRSAASVRIRGFDQGRRDVARGRRRHAAGPACGQRDRHVPGIGGRQLHRKAPADSRRHLHRLRHVPAGRFDRACSPPAGNAREGRAMIKVSALNKAFGGLRAVRNLSFEAAPHRVTSIIGPNGAGKSTAFNLIAGTLRPDSGTVELDGRDITGQAPFALARLGVARSFQITNLFFGLSAFENVRLACQSLERRNSYLVRLDRLARPQARARAILE